MRSTPPEVEYRATRRGFRDALPTNAVAALDDPEDRLLHLVRLEALARLLDDALLTPTGRTVLVAGCGSGRLAEGLAWLGYHVTGVDIDAEAIAQCRALACGDFHVSTLEAFAAPPFDAVCAIDALCHIADDDAWSASLGNLCRLTAPGGVLVLGIGAADHDGAASDYVVHRSVAAHEAILGQQRLHLERIAPCGLREQRASLRTYRREGLLTHASV